MGSRHTSAASPTALGWMLALLAVGALAGIAAAATLLSRKDRLQADDPDAPLFI